MTPPVHAAGGALALELAGLGAIAQRLLVLHGADEQGPYWDCTAPGTGSPGAVWPCALYCLSGAATHRPFTGQITAATGPGVLG